MKKSKKIDDEVSRIFRRDGEVKASVLLEESKRKDAPLHDLFEWNNGKASHQFRLIQSRNFIRVAVIVIDKEPERFVHVASMILNEQEGCYKPVTIVAESTDEFTYAYKEAMARLLAAQRALEELRNASMHRNKGKKGKSTQALITTALEAIKTANTALSKCA